MEVIDTEMEDEVETIPTESNAKLLTIMFR